MDSFPDPNLDSEPEETPPALHLEPRHKAELTKQCDYKGKHFAQENLPRNGQSRRQQSGGHHKRFRIQEAKDWKLDILERHLEQKTWPKGPVALGDKNFVSSAEFPEKFWFNKILLQNFG